MEQTSSNEKLILFMNFIQKYFTQILFAPILFGGIMQIIILFLISPQAIRFFSPTQAISDGLLYLSVVILYLFSIFITLLMTLIYGITTTDFSKLKLKDKNDKEEIPYKFSHERIPLVAHIVIFLIVLFLYYIFFILNPKFLDIDNLKISNILKAMFFAFMFNSMLSINLMRFIYFKEEYYFKKNGKTFIVINTILCFITVFIFSIYSSGINTSFSNFERIKEKYCCEKTGVVKIIYFNDKFIFIKRKCSDESEELIIEKFDALFEK